MRCVCSFKGKVIDYSNRYEINVQNFHVFFFQIWYHIWFDCKHAVILDAYWLSRIVTHVYFCAATYITTQKTLFGGGGRGEHFALKWCHYLYFELM